MVWLSLLCRPGDQLVCWSPGVFAFLENRILSCPGPNCLPCKTNCSGAQLLRGTTVPGPICCGAQLFWGPTVWGPTVRGPSVQGPNCPGPSCPFFRGGQLGPGQLGPGLNCPGPSCPFFRCGQLGPGQLGPGLFETYIFR